MTRYTRVPATYTPTGVRRFAGNPFIEALPRLEASKNAILDRIQNYPCKPTKSDRKQSELVRAAEVGCINEIVYPFAEYKRAGTNLTMNIREPYVARNPLSVEDAKRRHAIAMSDGEEVPFPSNWVSTAKGQSLLGISGSGKTTFANAFSLPYQIAIDHTSYNGETLVCTQIPWVSIRMSHDATLKSLCLQFFEVVDGILGNTHYLNQANAVRSIARMVTLIAKVSTAASVGAVFVDEVQNLKAATGHNAVFVLNLFSEIIERAGVSLVVAATPAIDAVIDENVRNLRKLNSGGESNFVQMRLHDPEFEAFCDVYWEYQFVKHPLSLTDPIRKAWYRAGAGNPAFTALAFMLAQRNEIGGREVIDAAAFDRVSKTEMAILEPAISALRSGKVKDLKAFDDLLFKEGCRSLRKLIAWSDGGESKKQPPEEFAEVAEPSIQSPGVGKSRRGTAKARDSASTTVPPLPMETPLLG